MKIVFMGTPDFAVHSLEALVRGGHNIVAVVTVPDKQQGRGRKIKPSPVKLAALAHKLPVLQPESLKTDDFIRTLRGLKADLFVVVAFKILPRAVFTIPVMGTLNVHASLLPAYRGAAPINWAIINGEQKTGVTTMLIDAQVDTGDILMQKSVEISDDMTAGELHDILAPLGAGLLLETLDRLQKGTVTPQAQDDRRASRAPKLTPENTRILFNQPYTRVGNFIRGLSPYPGAYTFLEGKKLKILKAVGDKQDFPHARPGEITGITKDSISVACQPGTIIIKRLQLQGKKQMDVRDFLNGFPLKEGEVLNVTE
ncbi:MAG TPA: methionyl-tRNA formyltransferase [Caldithrix abyssi]|uniref:Methionyl-tRNA formyltransferase n=1 Tax=Caldithrix abyssi TaxID=187145 RepID=A0A7V5VFK8_CALAY|nr:methionyl-tRNA formyltransferase [Caldithrix abyssi]